MSGTYLTWLAAELRAAGLNVVEFSGWQTRARSSGGFAAGRPVCVMWHHTASSTSPQNDANYMCNGSSARPIANILVARDGTVWVLAAGGTNTNGKGNSLRFSRGTVPADSMNVWAVGVEIANAGTGETYPKAQIDAMFAVSNVINRRLGNRPDDLAGHWDYAPTRKIDPAVNVTSAGWAPGSVNSSRTWRVADVRAEAIARAGAAPPPPGPDPTPIDPEEDDDMARCYLIQHPDNGGWYVTDTLTYANWVDEAVLVDEGSVLFGWPTQPPTMLGPGWAPYLDRLIDGGGGRP